MNGKQTFTVRGLEISITRINPRMNQYMVEIHVPFSDETPAIYERTARKICMYLINEKFIDGNGGIKIKVVPE